MLHKRTVCESRLGKHAIVKQMANYMCRMATDFWAAGDDPEDLVFRYRVTAFSVLVEA